MVIKKKTQFQLSNIYVSNPSQRPVYVFSSPEWQKCSHIPSCTGIFYTCAKGGSAAQVNIQETSPGYKNSQTQSRIPSHPRQICWANSWLFHFFASDSRNHDHKIVYLAFRLVLKRRDNWAFAKLKPSMKNNFDAMTQNVT